MNKRKAIKLFFGNETMIHLQLIAAKKNLYDAYSNAEIDFNNGKKRSAISRTY